MNEMLKRYALLVFNFTIIHSIAIGDAFFSFQLSSSLPYPRPVAVPSSVFLLRAAHYRNRE